MPAVFVPVTVAAVAEMVGGGILGAVMARMFHYLEHSRCFAVWNMVVSKP